MLLLPLLQVLGVPAQGLLVQGPVCNTFTPDAWRWGWQRCAAWANLQWLPLFGYSVAPSAALRLLVCGRVQGRAISLLPAPVGGAAGMHRWGRPQGFLCCLEQRVTRQEYCGGVTKAKLSQEQPSIGWCWPALSLPAAILV